MAAAFTEIAVRITPGGIFKGRDALKLGLHDYTVRRVNSRTEGKFIFNAGEWQAKLADRALHGDYTSILVKGADLPQIMEETVNVGTP